MADFQRWQAPGPCEGPGLNPGRAGRALPSRARVPCSAHGCRPGPIRTWPGLRRAGQPGPIRRARAFVERCSRKTPGLPSQDPGGQLLSTSHPPSVWYPLLTNTVGSKRGRCCCGLRP